MSEEGDEESFVILGTSPTDLSNSFATGNYEENGGSNFSSLKSGKNSIKYDSQKSPLNNVNLKFNSHNVNHYQLVTDSPNTETIRQFQLSSREQNGDISMISDNSNKDNSVKMPSFSKMILSASLENDKESMSSDSKNKAAAKEGSLAASFLMGDVQLDVLKATMHSQFPSLCSSTVKTEEMIKLQNVLAEYIELKETLQKNNIAMRKHFTTLQKWQDEVKTQKEEQTKQVNEFQETVAKLRNENLELRKELDFKIEQIQINEDTIRKEGQEMTKILSDKTAQIQNMASQIDKLEQQHLDSYEYIHKLKSENDNVKESNKITEHEYVPILEHKRIVTDLEQRLSESVAKNLELDDTIEKYLKEIEELKKKLSLCEEQIKKAQSDIIVLKSNDEEKKRHFENYEKERNELHNEVSVLKTQIEIYSKDFEMERLSRQNLAGEKEKVLADLRLLQKRNQELLESSKKHFETVGIDSVSTSQQSSLSNSTTNSIVSKEDQVYEPSDFSCPLCNRPYKLLKDLQTHVQECIN